MSTPQRDAMAEQISTPGSAAETSTTATKPTVGAPKDRACPFCQQPFTSSSLGRHLDLYIKEKNPKPADGVHDVDEIRKMRGAITRRQPRHSSSRRESSTPARTSALGGRGGANGSPRDTPTQSPSLVTRQPMVLDKVKVRTTLNQATWHSTGVINNIPQVNQRNELGGEDTAELHRKRYVSRQMLAKSTLDQKQKMMDALDTARAAELALREILGSIKAAVATVQPQHHSPFDFDPLSLDFPTLCLTCLPPPPTISQLTPIANPSSWSISPPSEPQYDSLAAYFREAFHSARIARTVLSSTTHPDDILYAHHATPSMQATINARAQEFEEKVTKHLHASFGYWMSLPPPNRMELWKLELARAVGEKDSKIAQLTSTVESVQQENAHLRQQLEYLSRCQQPREFAMAPPQTVTIGKRTAVELGEMGIRGSSVGFQLGDKGESLQKRVETAVGRWREIVRSSRGVGMQGQRSLSGQHQPQTPQGQDQSGQVNGGGDGTAEDDMDLDADGDVDADADPDEESYGNQLHDQLQQAAHVAEAPMMGGGYGGNQIQNQNRQNGNINHNGEAQNGMGQNAMVQNGTMGRRQGNVMAGVNGRGGGRISVPF